MGGWVGGLPLPHGLREGFKEDVCAEDFVVEACVKRWVGGWVGGWVDGRKIVLS